MGTQAGVILLVYAQRVKPVHHRYWRVPQKLREAVDYLTRRQYAIDAWLARRMVCRPTLALRARC